MKNLIYPARFEKEEDGQYAVFFPDFDDTATCGTDLADAYFMAEDLLGNLGIDYEQDKRNLPGVTDLSKFGINTNKTFMSLISIDFDEYKKRVLDKPIRKTLYIPKGLNDMAEEKGINFSQVLRDALNDMLIY